MPGTSGLDSSLACRHAGGVPGLWVKDRHLPLDAAAGATIGRHPDCEIVIDDRQASRRHARLWCDTGQWFIEDLESTHGTKVNGLALITGSRALAAGDRIRIGAVELRFTAEDPAPAPAGPSVAELDARDRARVGRTLGEMRLEAFVGQVATGAVYRAQSPRRRPSVLLTVLEPVLVQQPAFADRFLRDLTIAASVDHPGTVRILRSGAEDGLVWYSTDPPPGEPLAGELHQPVEPARAVRLARTLGEAVNAYHEHGLVHGDLGPGCATVQGERLRLLDIGYIGLARGDVLLLHETRPHRWGHRYTCPAQVQTGQCNARGDLYGLGSLLHHLLLGYPPAGHAGGALPTDRTGHAALSIGPMLHLPPLIDEILDILLHPDAFYRYTTLRAALDALDELERQMAAAPE